MSAHPNNSPAQKATFTWWIGWVVSFPFRFAFMFIFGTAVACSPKMFYGIMNSDSDAITETDQSKWRLL